MKNDKKFILKIYGSNGIGKSIIFLYFMAIKSDYKIIYFNLKDIRSTRIFQKCFDEILFIK